MDNKKFEQLIDLIINENEEQARALFHDIVVEKSREIYESIMDEEEETVEEGFGGEVAGDQVGGLLDEIDAEEQGMTEEEDEFADIDVDDTEGLEGEEEVAGEENLEDRVVDLEDKLDELMAEFEELMGSEGGEEDFGGEEGGEEDFGGEEEMSDEMMEAVQLQKVSVTHGDNGQNTKSIVSGGPKVGGNGAKAVSLGGGETGGKGGTQGGLLNPATKDLKGAGTFKNAPGNKNVDPTAAPKPKHGDDGQNSKSPLAK
jgi:hypothetical protein